MPFPSLRRRTVNEADQLPEDHKSPLPSPRARSATVPSLTPRKSLTSLMGSVRKRGISSPSPVKLQHDVFEQELYSVYDASNPEHDPFKAGQNPSASDKSKRYYRTPSPHPLKMSATSSSSRLPKLSRGTPGSRYSDSSQTGPPPKTFLEALADAIRAPTSLFYKENTSNSKTEDANISTNKALSPGRSVSPKKSVRFKPGKSIIESEPRSSPIDIPRPTPALPPVQLATTPLLQCFGNDHPHLIPTGRPPQPQVLDSTINFRQAMAAAQSSITENDLQDVLSVGSPLSERPLPLPRATGPTENPFKDPKDEHDMEVKRRMLREYDNQFSSKGIESCRPADILIEKRFVANDERIQDLPENNSAVAAVVTGGLSLALKMANHDGGRSKSISSSEIGQAELFPEAECTVEDDVSKLKSDVSPSDQGDTDSDCSHGRSVVLTSSSLTKCKNDEKWNETPTHEDIRLRFTHPECYESMKSRDAGSISVSNASSHEDTRAKAAITPLPDAHADWSPLQLPPSATVDEVGVESRKTKICLHSTSDGDPYFYVPETFLQNPPWVAELALRCDRPFPTDRPRQLSYIFPRARTERCESSMSLAGTITESEPDSGASLLPEYAEIEEKGSNEILSSLKAQTRSWQAVPRARGTPSPASIPLPLSGRPSVRQYYESHTDEYESCPFEDDREPSKCEPSNFGAGPAVNVEEYGIDYNRETDKHDPDRSNCFGLGSTSPNIPRDTEEEKLARAAQVLKKFVPQKASGSSSSQNPAIDTELKSLPEHTTRIPVLKRLEGWSPETEVESSSQRPWNRERATTAESKWSAGSKRSDKSSSGETLKTATSTDPSEAMDEDELLCKGIV
ncbi:uncharacterized protein Z519_07262 [Cladophialophora bantiana CBS 173.52]|uniref:Uncharacterized protein n=1 Tax=Cladophialophora bantiana (strain ATCC 10958 / CBS 173.52 / CDC B-1940 / NIH 8579) TaxID=1442370 RepID=A0A0D2HG75_CLAB1|nr:uncharacterized protein Z519_07262 [Cladophialophora bantiana CBS 173.52]KIW92278.1 hypothetical protein Z519_07262 [Cladophialophora bantiana CBS 173.52]